MTFEQFLQKIDYKFNNASYKEQLRYGQYVMNELYNSWPEKYSQIVGSEYDCFYDNRTVELTLNTLEKEWNNKEVN